MKIKTNYTIPKLCTRKNDLKKDWFVYFYYTDQQSGVKKLFRYKLGINYHKTKKEREREAEAIKFNLLERLENGWNPFTNETEKSSEKLTIIEAIESALNLKKTTLTKNSKKTYSDAVRIFKQYLVKKSLSHLYAYNFTGTMAQAYFDYLLMERRYSGVSHNNHLSFLSSLFSALEERQILQSNPCNVIKKVAEERGKNTTYSAEEESRFIEYIENKNFGFYLATRFVKYCFLRRTELHGLQVKHINLDNKTVVIPSDNAKSKFQDSVTIPKTLEAIIEKSGILGLPQDTYVFSKRFRPGHQKVNDDNGLTGKQKNLNRRLKIKPECSFYSWKHTGVVELYKLTKDPYIVMRQCRHSDIKTTMIYLRALGCGVNEHVREW